MGVRKAIAIRLPRIPRKYHPPRLSRASNPFKRGTKAAVRGVRRSLALHGAALAANNIPGKAIAAGALGGHLAGPGGAAAAFSAVEAGSIAATAALAARLARRRKLSSYLSRRGKRTRGVYKTRLSMDDIVEDAIDRIEKARGLIHGGSRATLRRLSSPKAIRRAADKEGAGVLYPRKLARAQRYLRGRYMQNAVDVKRNPKAPLGSRARRGVMLRRGVYKALDLIEKARYAVRLSPKQRRNAIVGRNQARNEALGFSRTRGRSGQSKHMLSPGARFLRTGNSYKVSAYGNNAASRALRDAKRGTGDRRSDRLTIQNAREVLARRFPSKYKAGFGGGLKRVRKLNAAIERCEAVMKGIYRSGKPSPRERRRAAIMHATRGGRLLNASLPYGVQGSKHKLSPGAAFLRTKDTSNLGPHELARYRVARHRSKKK